MSGEKDNSIEQMKNGISIGSFSNQTKQDKKLLKKFVDFHWRHYKADSQYVPLLDYEYLGFKLIGVKGFFEPDNLFFKHADMLINKTRITVIIIRVPATGLERLEIKGG